MWKKRKRRWSCMRQGRRKRRCWLMFCFNECVCAQTCLPIPRECQVESAPEAKRVNREDKHTEDFPSKSPRLFLHPSVMCQCLSIVSKLHTQTAAATKQLTFLYPAGGFTLSIRLTFNSGDMQTIATVQIKRKTATHYFPIHATSFVLL